MNRPAQATVRLALIATVIGIFGNLPTHLRAGESRESAKTILPEEINAVYNISTTRHIPGQMANSILATQVREGVLTVHRDGNEWLLVENIEETSPLPDGSTHREKTTESHLFRDGVWVLATRGRDALEQPVGEYLPAAMPPLEALTGGMIRQGPDAVGRLLSFQEVEAMRSAAGFEIQIDSEGPGARYTWTSPERTSIIGTFQVLMQDHMDEEGRLVLRTAELLHEPKDGSIGFSQPMFEYRVSGWKGNVPSHIDWAEYRPGPLPGEPAWSDVDYVRTLCSNKEALVSSSGTASLQTESGRKSASALSERLSEVTGNVVSVRKGTWIEAPTMTLLPPDETGNQRPSMAFDPRSRAWRAVN